MKLNISNISTYFIIMLISGCVEPPDYDDGLLENIPAIVNDDDYFSLSLYAENHTQNYNWNLDFSSTNEDTLFTSLIIKDYLGSIADSSTLILYNSNEAEIFNILLNKQVTKETVKNLASELNISQILSKILVARGINTFKSAQEFFRPHSNQFHDGFLMKGMEQAVSRIKKAVEKNENILESQKISKYRAGVVFFLHVDLAPKLKIRIFFFENENVAFVINLF